MTYSPRVNDSVTRQTDRVCTHAEGKYADKYTHAEMHKFFGIRGSIRMKNVPFSYPVNPSSLFTFPIQLPFFIRIFFCFFRNCSTCCLPFPYCPSVFLPSSSQVSHPLVSPYFLLSFHMPLFCYYCPHASLSSILLTYLSFPLPLHMDLFPYFSLDAYFSFFLSTCLSFLLLYIQLSFILFSPSLSHCLLPYTSFSFFLSTSLSFYLSTSLSSIVSLYITSFSLFLSTCLSLLLSFHIPLRPHPSPQLTPTSL